MKKLLSDPYLELLRINHWFKNSFVFAGFFFALWYLDDLSLRKGLILSIFFGFLLTSAISSANYIINQITDAKFDSRHPYKKLRPIPSGKISVKQAWQIFITLSIISMFAAHQFFSTNFTLVLLTFWVAGLAYNIPPIRLKDIPYIDVLAESINNPIRFLLGWFVVVPSIWPPLSVLVLTWSGGAFLMVAKRYDELRVLGDKLVPYRQTFKSYTLRSLRLSLYLYFLITLGLFGYVSWVYEKKFIVAWFPIALFFGWIIREVISGRANARSIETFVLTPRFILGSVLILVIFLFLALY